MAFPPRLFAIGLMLCTCQASLVAAAGCSGKGGREPRTYTRSGPRDPVAEARMLLEAYRNGQSLGSEQELFDELIAATKDVAPVKATVIERAFTEIQKRPGDAAMIAKRTLGEL